MPSGDVFRKRSNRASNASSSFGVTMEMPSPTGLSVRAAAISVGRSAIASTLRATSPRLAASSAAERRRQCSKMRQCAKMFNELSPTRHSAALPQSRATWRENETPGSTSTASSVSTSARAQATDATDASGSGKRQMQISASPAKCKMSPPKLSMIATISEM